MQGTKKVYYPIQVIFDCLEKLILIDIGPGDQIFSAGLCIADFSAEDPMLKSLIC